MMVYRDDHGKIGGVYAEGFCRILLKISGCKLHHLQAGKVDK